MRGLSQMRSLTLIYIEKKISPYNNLRCFFNENNKKSLFIKTRLLLTINYFRILNNGARKENLCCNLCDISDCLSL